MIYTENAINILTVKSYKGIGRAWINKNMRGNERVEDIVSFLRNGAKEDYPITVEEFETTKSAIKENLKKLESAADGFVAIGDPDFPPYRGKVKNSEQPIFLFYRGDLTLLKSINTNVAMIGLLNPDSGTEIIEKEVVDKLVTNKATIVSGLALGCDTIAHRQALNSGGKTVAILPSPLNNILPAKNKELASEIVKRNGLLITEYYKDVKSKMELGGRYQERDRLQALFSDFIILSASYAKNDQGDDSGSRFAMGYALNYSIPRAVIYDPESDLNNPKYDLSRQLIREQKEITIINRRNLAEKVDEIISFKPSKENEFVQASLL